VRICIECGCTEDRACPGGCAWVSPDLDLCTACAAKPLKPGTHIASVTDDVHFDLSSDRPGGTIAHLAGACIQYESLQRQRCSWCGAILIDDDLSRMAVQIAPCARCGVNYMHGQHDEENGYCVVGNDVRQPHYFESPSLPSGFPAGEFVEVTKGGGFRGSSVLEVVATDDGIVTVPTNSCLRLPPQLTGEDAESLTNAKAPDSVDPS
jgi:hypothetical protein